MKKYKAFCFYCKNLLTGVFCFLFIFAGDGSRGCLGGSESGDITIMTETGVPFYFQETYTDCGLACSQMMIGYYYLLADYEYEYGVLVPAKIEIAAQRIGPEWEYYPDVLEHFLLLAGYNSLFMEDYYYSEDGGDEFENGNDEVIHNLKRLIDTEDIAMAFFTEEGYGNAHSVVVIGYIRSGDTMDVSENIHTIYYNDPAHTFGYESASREGLFYLMYYSGNPRTIIGRKGL